MDNTYIFFAADHGLSVGHHGLIGKQSLFDLKKDPNEMTDLADDPKWKRTHGGGHWGNPDKAL